MTTPTPLQVDGWTVVPGRYAQITWHSPGAVERSSASVVISDGRVVFVGREPPPLTVLRALLSTPGDTEEWQAHDGCPACTDETPGLEQECDIRGRILDECRKLLGCGMWHDVPKAIEALQADLQRVEAHRDALLREKRTA